MNRLTRFAGLISLVLAALLCAPSGSRAAEDSLRVSGAVDHPREWTASQILTELASSLQTVTFQLKGEQHTARGVPLTAIALPAQPRFENETKNHELGFAVFVRGRDGYTVCFSLGELSPVAGKPPVWLACEVDGKLLPSKEGPVRILVPGDAKPARWIYGVVSITLVDGRHLEPAK